ncbi:MAG: hypothetical protein F7C35_03750 [Desulfurococcales archaeon]|nr:hypothetical protein [Desulfurococcales archaeon]
MIGELVDRLIEENREKVFRGLETELLDVSDRGLEILSFDPSTGKVVTAKITRVSRHEAPEVIVRLKLENGVTLEVTPEHPILTLSDAGTITTKPALQVMSGELIAGAPCYRQGNHISAEAVEAMADRMLKTVSTVEGVGGLAVYLEVERLPGALLSADWEARRIFASRILELLETFDNNTVFVKGRDAALDLLELLHSVGVKARIRGSDGGWRVEVLGSIPGGCRGAVPIKVREVEIASYNKEWVYDVTVEPHHLFVSRGLVLHNSISISKAGIVARLNARASVLAAGNPKYGIYLPKKDFADNVNLPPAILSRFDLIFVVKDVIDQKRDELLATYILEAHSNAEKFKPEIEPALLKKYIIYARRYVRPKLTPQAKRLIKDFFVRMRSSASFSVTDEGELRTVPITARQLEAIVRLAEAHAKMALRDEVGEEDAEEAIRITLSFLTSVGYDMEAGTLDSSIIMTGKSLTKIRLYSVITDVMKSLMKGSECVKVDDIIKAITERYNVSKEKVRSALEAMDREGLVYKPRHGCYAPV